LFFLAKSNTSFGVIQLPPSSETAIYNKTTPLLA